jgi:hypothetical protein
MAKLDHALALAAEGFYVFPVQQDKKIPVTGVRFKQAATRDEATIRAWWTESDHNIGVYTGRFGENEALVVVDVDNKQGKNGDAEILRLELEGFELPDTRATSTPTGGRHLVFRVATPLRQGVNVLGQGVDIRSRGGFVLGRGSTIGGKSYADLSDLPVAPAPRWLVDRLGAGVREPAQPALREGNGTDPAAAAARAARYLERDAPLAVEGEGGDETTFKVACRIKDFGVDFDTALHLMLELWNERCSPPWPGDVLFVKIRNAYAYGIEPPGVAAPENDFKPVETATPAAELSPYQKLNRDYAFVLAGGGAHILWETTDKDGRFTLEHLTLSAFHQKHAAVKVTVGKKSVPLTVDWMEWPERRSFDGIVFMPEQPAPARFFNLWRGFAVEPWRDSDGVPDSRASAAVAAFHEHALRNICRGDETLYRWLIGYFAHLVQRPWEKPLVALVFKGGKGVGKNALIETVGALLGGHFLLSSNRRYLIGNFNGHLENCLLFALDEAVWAGDKQTEGTLKDLVTGKHHVIEHKGKEPYTVDNRTRVAIIGNEEWLVPASHDERRFAVFDVGDGRKQDRRFFQEMREGMEWGGYRLLLRQLLDADITRLDINEAPGTEALLEQKTSSLDPFPQWWLACLTEGRIVASDFGAEWPDEVECERFRVAFRRWAKEHNIRARMLDERGIGKHLKRVCAGHHHTKVRGTGYVYRFPALEACRAAWGAFMGHEMEWPE